MASNEFEGDWPFSDEVVEVDCDGSTPFALVNGTRYALTGLGQTLGGVPLTSESSDWLDDQEIPGAKVALTDFTTAAMDFCDSVGTG